MFLGDEISDISSERSSPGAKILALQVLGGGAGGCAGALVGGMSVYLVMTITGWGEEGSLFSPRALGAYIGAGFGYSVGSALGVWGVGKVAGRKGALPQTLLGTAVGTLAGYALWARTNTVSFFVGQVVGSVIGYNWSEP